MHNASKRFADGNKLVARSILGRWASVEHDADKRGGGGGICSPRKSSTASERLKSMGISSMRSRWDRREVLAVVYSELQGGDNSL
jgi:hypothetical protein